MLVRHEIVFGLCVRLLRGEVIDVAADKGRIWRGTMNSFSLMFLGAPSPLLENADAYDVALLLSARSGES